MSLFQTSVVKKYLNDLSPELIDKKYKAFQDYFGNAERQENIRNSKEEEYQSGFVSALFVNILEYTLNPEPNFNFVLEKKNVDDSKKADGAILKDENVVAVIELKSTKTTDLDTVETQAFGYKNHHPKCQYIITSNFEKIRIYIQNAIDHLEFDLFNLSKEDFALLWLCFSKDNILNNIPLKIKEASVLQEENVTKELYKDYSKFRKDIFENIVKNNPELDKLVLFKKTQKLLDRFLFIFFAEDKLLVPPNSINQIIEKWKDDVDFGDNKPLYSIFKQYFHVLNVGRPKSGKRQEIFAYNGGLFLPDEILDNIKIDDEVLHQNTLQLSTYDFETEVDVNILGHIFEHSLSEIENVQAEIAGEEIDKQKTKRKKDGIFYTPKYITKYIVENTVGKLCEEKRTEFGIIDEEYAKGRRNRKKDIVRDLDNKLIKYREWLLEITILDPACGSGAFLNQALEFLINEHKKIDELKAQLLGGSIIFPDIEAKILEKNIYGVDLNEESVEIAKLSLWLRTAQKGRKLTTLSNHIKCGNSLIDDPEIAGEKAFKWKDEFSEVFEKGGFDVVIGNPPYVNSKDENFTDNIKAFLTEHYNTAIYQIDLYILFLEKSIQLQNSLGICSLIIPNAWLNNLFLKDVRKYILENSSLYQIISMPPNTFADANVDTVIVSFGKNERDNETELKACQNGEFFKLGAVVQNQWLLDDNYTINVHVTNEINQVLEKIKINSVSLHSFTEIARGVGVYHKRVGHTKELIAKDPFQSDKKEDDTFVPYLRGKNVNSWNINWNNDSFISYGKWLAEPREPKYFDGRRIVLRQIPSNRLIATYIQNKFITDQSVFIARFTDNNDGFEPKSILALITSKLFSFYFRYFYSEFDDLFPKVKLQHFKDLPIHNTMNSNHEEFTEAANKRLMLSDDFNSVEYKFVKFIKSQFQINIISNKLQNWYQLEFSEFIKELNKTIKKVGGEKLTKMDEMEWMEVFETKKAEVQTIKSEIDKTDKEIDQMVYNLYGLTEEEIKIVEETS